MAPLWKEADMDMTQHKVIWLQPACCEGDEGRLWCEDDVGPCECGKPWIKYILAEPSHDRKPETASRNS